MRAKNGFYCPLSLNYRYALDDVREAFRLFSEEFEQAAALGEPLRFDLSVFDEKFLMTFGDEILSAPTRLQCLFNDALDDIKMPYAVQFAMRTVGTLRFYCRIVRYDWIKMTFLPNETKPKAEARP